MQGRKLFLAHMARGSTVQSPTSTPVRLTSDEIAETNHALHVDRAGRVQSQYALLADPYFLTV